MNKVGSLNYKVVLKGSNYLGTWVGKGNFFMGWRGPRLWLRKAYDDRQKAGKTAVIYESESIESRYAEGMFNEEDRQKNYSGKWRIEAGFQHGPTNTF